MAESNDVTESKTAADVCAKTDESCACCDICNSLLTKDCIVCAVSTVVEQPGNRIAAMLPDIESPCVSVAGVCGHAFHHDCIDRWLAGGRDECPRCDKTWCPASAKPAMSSYAWGIGAATYLVAHRVPTNRLADVTKAVRALFSRAPRTGLGVTSAFPRAADGLVNCKVPLVAWRGPRVDYFLVVDDLPARTTVGEFRSIINHVMRVNDILQQVRDFDSPKVAGRLLRPNWSESTVSARVEACASDTTWISPDGDTEFVEVD